MAALVTERATPEGVGELLYLPMAAASKILAGAIACRDAAGNIVKGAASTTLRALGRSEETVDNLAGIAGDKSVHILAGSFWYANSTAGDLIANADIGNACFIADDQTVAKTNGGATRSQAGRVMEVSATLGVRVMFGPQYA